MMIGFFVIVRIMLLNVIVKPWDHNFGKDKVANTPLNKNKMKIIASIIYHTIFKNFREYLPTFPDNQKELPD